MSMHIIYIIAKLIRESNILPGTENLPKDGWESYSNLCKLNKYSVSAEYVLNFYE